MERRDSVLRYIIIFVLIGILTLACVVRLLDLQIVHGDEYRQLAEQKLIQAYPVRAPRGEILDRNGKGILENRMGYVVQFQKTDCTNDELNDKIFQVSDIIVSAGNTLVSEFPIFYDSVSDTWGFTYTETKEIKAQIRQTEADIAREIRNGDVGIDYEAANRLREENQKKLDEWKESHKLTQFQTAKEIVDYLRAEFGVGAKYSNADALKIVSVRYDMQESKFSENNPYIMARDVNDGALQKIKEQKADFPGVVVEIEPVRVYAHGSMAAHILGRTGKIYAEEYAELKDKGYGINDIIGKDGLEKALEPYLKGTDGYKNVSMSRGGGQSQLLQSQPASPGNYAKLSLDVDLQEAMEKALRDTVIEACDSGGAGGAIAIKPDTGEVLALASYPTYDPETFDEDYEKLVQAKAKPLFNRVLSGIYSPGSTFKPLTAIAGLETGEISPNTYIEDKGKYTFFDSYQPTCLVYSSTGATHGTIEVSEALGVSCNYFFYEVGRRVGIERLDDYAARFGLGESTGIELDESKGLMANPKHREELGQVWYPGDVIQAAIGQSDELFTPAQLANYVATILNKGKRYKLHLVNEIVDYKSGDIVLRNNPQVLSENPIADSTFQKVTEGMRQVVTMGTARGAFETASYKAAGKTGTAEVPDGRDNVLFVGFAPYENPEIVVAVIIEHGANSIYPATVARRIFDAYLELKKRREDPNAKKKPIYGESLEESDNESAPVVTKKPTGTEPEAPSSTPKPTAQPSATAKKGKAPGQTESPSASGSPAGDGTL